MQLTITPACAPGESAIGYTLRLLHRNGVLSADRALNKTTLTDITKGKPAKDGALDKRLPLSRRLTQMKVSHWAHSRLLTAQVCLQCIHQQGYLKAQWQNPFLRHCFIHDCALVSQCPHCKTPLAFDINLLHGRCTSSRCGKRLTQLAQSEALTSQERVHDAYLFAMLFADAQNKRSSFPPITITTPLLEAAADLLSNPDKVHTWLKERALALPECTPLNVSFNAIHTVANKLLCEWPAMTVFRSMYSQEYPRSQAPLSQLWFEAKIACDIIGITFQQAPLLLELGLIKTKSTGKIYATSQVEISAVYAMLDAFPHQNEYVPLSQLNQMMAYHNICLSDVFIAIKNNELSIAYKPMNDLMHSIHVQENAFTSFCVLHTKLMRDKVMTISTVADVTGIPRVEVLRLISRGKLTPVYIKGSDSRHILNTDVIELKEHKNEQLTLGI